MCSTCSVYLFLILKYLPVPVCTPRPGTVDIRHVVHTNCGTHIHVLRSYTIKFIMYFVRRKFFTFCIHTYSVGVDMCVYTYMTCRSMAHTKTSMYWRCTTNAPGDQMYDCCFLDYRYLLSFCQSHPSCFVTILIRVHDEVLLDYSSSLVFFWR